MTDLGIFSNSLMKEKNIEHVKLDDQEKITEEQEEIESIQMKNTLIYLKDQYEVAKERLQIEKDKYESLKSAIYNLENALNQLGYISLSYTGMSVVDATHKLLSMRGELTTQEIYSILKEKGIIWKAKNPLNSLSAILHNAAKGNRKGNRIVHVGLSKWDVIHTNKE